LQLFAPSTFLTYNAAATRHRQRQCAPECFTNKQPSCR